LLPDGPAHASWLSDAEKATISMRRVADDATTERELWPALRDPRVLALGLVNFGLLFSGYGVAFWLPQIVQAMGFSNLATGFVVALPFLVSIPIMVLWGRSSDVRSERIWHVALPALLAAGGFVVASFAQDDLLVLLGLGFSAIGILAMQPPLVSLPSLFLSGPAAAGGLAVIVSIGSLGGFLGPTIVGALRGSSENYSYAMAVLAFPLVVSAAIVLALGRAMKPRPVLSAIAKVSKGSDAEVGRCGD
jgi:ACS family tartrate transporter-like MFS transporter